MFILRFVGTGPLDGPSYDYSALPSVYIPRHGYAVPHFLGKGALAMAS